MLSRQVGPELRQVGERGQCVPLLADDQRRLVAEVFQGRVLHGPAGEDEPEDERDRDRQRHDQPDRGEEARTQAVQQAH